MEEELAEKIREKAIPAVQSVSAITKSTLNPPILVLKEIPQKNTKRFTWNPLNPTKTLETVLGTPTLTLQPHPNLNKTSNMPKPQNKSRKSQNKTSYPVKVRWINVRC